MNRSRWVELELHTAGLASPLRMRIGEARERWVASVSYGSATSDGLGATAREALAAALAPLGTRARTAVMADPAMFAASAELLAVPAV